MNYPNPTEHNGYTISATVLKLSSGKWRGSCVIEKDGVAVRRAANGASFHSQAEAEHQSISIGRKIAEGDIPGLP
jgi:hypothetical protein